jgi:putative endonuclease
MRGVPREFWVYIVASARGTLYIGMTGDIHTRVLQHKNKRFEGFTSKYDCNRLVWYESWDDPRTAINREKELKGKIRKKKIDLIESRNPRWADWARTWGSPMLMRNEKIKDQKQSVGWNPQAAP